MKRIALFSLLLLALFSGCNNTPKTESKEPISLDEAMKDYLSDEPETHPTKSDGFDKLDDIKLFIEAQYLDKYYTWELYSYDSFAKFGDNYEVTIKFTYYKKDKKMFAVNNITVDGEDGTIKDISYSYETPYDQLVTTP
jgi:hypothetical protein